MTTLQDSEIIKLYTAKVDKLNQIAIDVAHSDNFDFEVMYMSSKLAELIKMMLDCNQYDNPSKDEICIVDRVVKVQRLVPKELSYRSGMHYTLCSGFYTTVMMYLLPISNVNKAMNNRWKAVMSTEEFGLPSTDLVDYATLRPYSGTHYSALAKVSNSLINQVITSAKYYRNVSLPDVDVDTLSVDLKDRW